MGWLTCLSLCYQYGRLGYSSRLLLSGWSCPEWCQYLGSEPINEKSLSFCLSLPVLSLLSFHFAHCSLSLWLCISSRLKKQTNIKKTDHTLSHKTNLTMFENIEIMQSIFFSHNGIKIEINFKKTRKFPNTWRRNNVLVSNPQAQEKVLKNTFVINGTQLNLNCNI